MFQKIQPKYVKGNFPCGVWANVSWNMLKQGRVLLADIDNLISIPPFDTSSSSSWSSFPHNIKPHFDKKLTNQNKNELCQGYQEFPFPEPTVKKKTKLHGFPQLFNHIFLLMSRKYVCAANQKYVRDQYEKLIVAWHHHLYIPTARKSVAETSEWSLFYLCINYFPTKSSLTLNKMWELHRGQQPLIRVVLD